MNFLLVTSVVLIVCAEARQASFYTTYKCIDGLCQRNPRSIDSIDLADLKSKRHHTSLAACRLVCDKHAALWPLPTGSFTTGQSYVQINPNQFYFDVNTPSPATKSILVEATSYLEENFRASCKQNCSEAGTSVLVHISVTTPEIELNWRTKENYTLDISANSELAKVTVTINAPTVFGARHALETLGQLTAPIKTGDDGNGLVIIDHAMIIDGPIFPHRGLLIDTARNFLSMHEILKTIDGLAAVKMNVLHWHATDSQSFPIQIKSVPLMAKYGSYGPDKVYSETDMKQVVSYAKSRGVRVVLELDSPSHAGAGWDWGESFGLGKLAVCVNQQPWREFCIQPPCGQLNPVNPNTYKILHDIYKDVLEIFGTKALLHLGGDEVFLPCWNSTPEIVSAMAEKGLGRRAEDFHDVWAGFHASQLKILDEVRGGSDDSIVLWSSALTAPETIEKHLDKNRFVIQTWVENTSELPKQLLHLGYRLIISTKNTWYLDHGFWGKTSYHTWREAYLNRIPKNDAVLGGEDCMWGEYVNSGSLETRVWPRTAAVAERLWSDPPGSTTYDVERRLSAQIERMEARGVDSDAIVPEWCTQHERQCS